MSTYAGVKIPDEIIIVEKLNSDGEHQGYVVESGNKKMLESAMSWAKTCVKKQDGSGYETIEGVCHTYKNGSFKIALKDSAGGSSQGGRLSFWNCIIFAPDDNKFLIGINSAILLEFLLHNDIFKGVCYAEIFLGRINGNTGVFTKNMPAYKQFVEDEQTRKTCDKKTSTYKPGDIVSTLTTQSIYLGTVETKFDVEYSWSEGHVFTIYAKPHVIHVFQNCENAVSFYRSISIDTYPNKPKRAITGHTDEFISPETAIKEYYQNNERELTRFFFEGTNDELMDKLKELYLSEPVNSFPYRNYRYSFQIV